MQKSIASVGLLGLLASAPVAPPPVVAVTPVFWRGQDKPAFTVRCRNESGAARAGRDYAVKSGFRLDGALHEQRRFTGSAADAPGDVANGAAFTELVLLGEASRAPSGVAASVGASVTTPWEVPLKPGEHRIAFRCWAEWSQEVAFFWGQT
jgi:hypothetical protein